MNKAADNFVAFLNQCREFNPSSLTARASNAPEKIESATKHGLLLVPDDLRGKRVLILGCGDGYEVEYACNDLGWNAIGVTFHTDEIKHRCCDPSRMVNCDLHALDLPDASFDFCYSKETLEHVACPMLALIEMNRVLRPNARFFHLIADGWAKQRDWYHLSCFPEWLWCDLFRKAYCHVEQVSGFPDSERCEFENKAYMGCKVADRSLTDGVEGFKKQLGFSRF